MTPFCPHCSGELRLFDTRTGGRCPNCRLVVGPGRARKQALAEVRSGGFMANAARREEAEPVAEESAFTALRAVAAEMGCAVERLRMTDYDRVIRTGRTGPSVAQVLATFDTWKIARTAAGASPGARTLRDAGAAEAGAA